MQQPRTATRHAIAALLCAAGLTSVTSAAVVTRGPYLQVPRPDGMTIRWRTDVPTDSRVQYGPAPGSLGASVSDPTLTTEHVVTLNSLAPDTTVYYSVGSALGALVGDDADHYLHTNPTPGTVRPIRIFATGDGGYMNYPSNPTLNTNSINVRNAYYAYTGATPTDLFMPLGDNAYTTSTDIEMQRAIFDGFPTLIRSTPILPIYGNHEEFGSDTLTATGPWFNAFSMPTAGEAGGVASGSKTYFSFDYGNVHIVVLDSERARPADSGAMMAWLAADLAAADADWTIAMWHRPPYSRGLFHDSDSEAEEKWMRENVLPVLEAYGVDAVYCGHSHNYERSHFLDGHYGLASTFTTAFIKEPGDGDPAGDGPYRKVALGAGPHSGAVYTVAGSSSEVRNSTLNHPAHRENRLELGALVIDIDGNTLTTRFLRDTGAISDQFQIVKGHPCDTPAAVCNAGAIGKLKVKNNADNTKDRFSWRWKSGAALDTIGDPTTSTDLSVCIYDATGRLLGGQIPRGAAWKPGASLVYKDKLGTYSGVQVVRIKPNLNPAKSTFTVKGKGAATALGTLPATLPLRAQLLNLDTGACWESTLPIATKNDGTTLKAKIP